MATVKSKRGRKPGILKVLQEPRFKLYNELVAEGFTAAQVAARMGMTPANLEIHDASGGLQFKAHAPAD